MYCFADYLITDLPDCFVRWVYADAESSPVLSIWRKPDDAPARFYLVEESAPRDLSEPVRRWTAMARTLADMRNG